MCVIVFFKNPTANTIVLSKNRDRNYKPKVEIVHEIINGVEVAYMRDLYTEWTEGLNEFGYGIINASLQVDYDENPMNASPRSKEINLLSQAKYLNALSKSSFNEFMNTLFDPVYYADIGLQGHTIAANPYFGFHIESMENTDPNITVLDNYYVGTNHGIRFKNTGYTHGKPLLSSILRQKLIEAEFENYPSLDDITKPDDIFDLMNKNYSDIDVDLHPYRNNPKYFFTTSQLNLNLTNRILTFKYDAIYSTFMGIKNNLPQGYEPKIKIVIDSTYKKPETKKVPINKSVLKKIFKKYVN
jgi:hypothetical protein